MTVLIYLIIVATQALVLATHHLNPSLLFQVTREDGIVEWSTVLALLALSFLCLKLTPHEYPKRLKVAAYGLGVLSLLAAGEEMSWGQRLFGFEASESFQQLNHQNETNLHNLIPAPLFNGIIIFGVAIAFTIAPMVWRTVSEKPPWWLPTVELSALTMPVVLVNHYRVSSFPEQAGLGLLFMVLALSTVQAIRAKRADLVASSFLAWSTAGVLYYARFSLPAANAQYEIRELLIILLVAKYCRQLQSDESKKIAIR